MKALEKRDIKRKLSVINYARKNGKAERSHRTYKQEFYQFIEYTDDVDLGKKITEWEDFYNFNRPHLSHGGLTPYEIFRAKMNIDIQSQPKSEV